MLFVSANRFQTVLLANRHTIRILFKRTIRHRPEMCGETQKTLTFYTEKRKKGKPCALTPWAPLQLKTPRPPTEPQECRWEPAGRPGGTTSWESLAWAWTGNDSSLPQAAGQQLPHTASPNFQVEKRNTTTMLKKQDSAPGPPLAGCLP